jgi:hypothetical protein
VPIWRKTWVQLSSAPVMQPWIENNLLPYWLTQFPGHPLLRIFDQEAMALGWGIHDCGELHRPECALPQRRCRGKHTGVSGLVRGQGR